MQKGHEFHFATMAAINSRSSMLHELGPRMVACVHAPMGLLKNSR